MQKNETISLINQYLQNGDYPESTFYNDWETMLLNQFHDILPGSSIEEVYDTTKLQYEEIINRQTEIFGKNLEEISKNISKKGIVVYNPTGYVRSDYVDVEGEKLFSENVPPHGWSVIDEQQQHVDGVMDGKRFLQHRYR